MRRKLFISASGIIATAIAVWFFLDNKQVTFSVLNADVPGLGIAEDLQSRKGWEFNRIADPLTNSIPTGIRRAELEFARRLPKGRIGTKSDNWVNRGPWNVGGRTRGAAIDVNNDNIIVAGGVSGGLWRSTDMGQSWNKMTQPEDLHNVTCVVQDKRPGKTNTWYYGTGESYGNSAGESFTATFLGDGIYKSTDNGVTWQWMESTHSGTPHFYDNWDYIWDMAIDPSDTINDKMYVAGYRTIKKSLDGGETWTDIVPYNSMGSRFSNVEVTSNGTVYYSLGSDGNVGRGIYRSEDGETFVGILPNPANDTIDTVAFPSTYYRVLLTVNPHNENELFVFAHTPGYGQHSNVFFGGEEWNSLWKYTYISGNGAGYGGVWQNLSANLPASSSSRFDNLYVQGSYNMVMEFKPDDPNILILGGTNLYRSTDLFSTPGNVRQIGGYKIGSVDLDWDIYPSHHPDQHVVLFPPSQPNSIISCNDGGIFKTNDVYADTVSWERLNNGYVTTQLYTIMINELGVDDKIIGGFQDNGNFYVNSEDPAASWVMPLNGDGSYGHICNNGDYYVLSIQRGKVYKLQIDENGNTLAYTRIDPIGPGQDDYEFINPIAVDPNNHSRLYIPCYRGLYRNDSVAYLPYLNNKDSIGTGWFKYTYEPSNYVSAIAVSKNPANRLYYGSGGRLYRLDDAHTANPTSHTMYSISTTTPGNISSIAIDPRNADNVLVVMSPYRVYSLHYTNDGGDTWFKVGGNLEEYASGAGNGPSIRWATIMPFGEKSLYIIATSVGVYATDSLRIDADSTVWTNVGNGIIGNVVCEMIQTRETDNLVAVATHGNGAYTIKLDNPRHLFGVEESQAIAKSNITVYPNPVKSTLNVVMKGNVEGSLICSVYDRSGKKVFERLTKEQSNSELRLQYDVHSLPAGVYTIVMESKDRKDFSRFIKYD